MNVVFGKNKLDEHIKAMKERYIVLELDTFKGPMDSVPITCYGIISAQDLTIEKLPKAEQMAALHQNMMANFGTQNWQFCVDAIEHLMDFWPEGYSEFYQSILDRIADYTANPPGDNWKPIIIKDK